MRYNDHQFRRPNRGLGCQAKTVTDIVKCLVLFEFYKEIKACVTSFDSELHR